MAARRGNGVAITALALVGFAGALSGCAKTRLHQGYVMDNALIASVQPGVDNQESVQKLLGDPSYAAQFDPSTWYYVSRTTRQFSFGLPKPVNQTVLAVHFDPRGNVASLERTGLEKVVKVPLEGDKTPTLGRHRSLFQELFGNIGAVGSAATGAPTADNPNGSTGP